MKHTIFLDQIIHDSEFDWDIQDKRFTESSSMNMFLDWLIVDISENNVTEFYKWMEENITGKWEATGEPEQNTSSYYIHFDNEEDAMAFKLRWL